MAIRDWIIGTAGAALIVAAIALLALVRPAEPVDPDSIEVPQLTLVEPSDGAEISGPLTLVFEPGTSIRPGPAGWESGPLHLHVFLNDQDLMPARNDIRPLEDGRYVWDLPRLQPGEYEIQVVWALDTHGGVRARGGGGGGARRGGGGGLAR
jgi:hypothetical protein